MLRTSIFALAFISGWACSSQPSAPTPTELTLSASATQLSADGSDAAQITVLSTSSSGATVATSLRVSLSITGGYFGADPNALETEIDLVEGAGSVEARCSGNGNATVNATAGILFGRVRITCGTGVAPTGTTGMTGGTGPTGAASLSSIAVTAANAVVLTSGTTQVSATVKQNDGSAAADGTQVLFTTDLGTLGGGASVAVVNTVGGVATATLSAPANAGRATVSASFTDLGGTPRSGSVALRVVAPSDVSLVVNTALKELSSPGSTSAITATLYQGASPYAGQALDVVLAGPQGVGTLVAAAGNGTLSADGRRLDGVSTSASGVVSLTFSAGVASGTATIEFRRGLLTESISIEVKGPGSLGAVQFVSATPSVIRVKGSINPNVSTLEFLLVDNAGAPVPAGMPVAFALSESASNDVFVSPVYTTTIEGGKATTVLSAGGQAETVTVTATASTAGVTVSATSTAIAITGGIPEYSHLSWACLQDESTQKGLFYDGAETHCTLRLADRFSNNVDIGTQVSFRAEAGRVNATGVVDKVTGTVTAVLDSAEPRPSFFYTTPTVVQRVQSVASYGRNPAMPLPDFTEEILPGEDLYSMPLLQRLGRVKLIGVTQGEESFIDGNGNKIYDQGEIFIDLPEPFLDKNENGLQDSCLIAGVPFTSDASEFYACYEDFLDLNGDGVWNTGNSKWDNYTAIWKGLDITWVDHATIDLYPATLDDLSSTLFNADGSPNLAANDWGTLSPAVVTIGAGGRVALTPFVVRVSDQNYNCDTHGEAFTVEAEVEGIDGVAVSTSDASCYSLLMLSDGTATARTGGGTATGLLTLTVTNTNDGIIRKAYWPVQLPLAP